MLSVVGETNQCLVQQIIKLSAEYMTIINHAVNTAKIIEINDEDAHTNIADHESDCKSCFALGRLLLMLYH
jgi:hypothetical protein